MKRFAFIKQHGSDVPTERLCQMFGVTSRGFRAWRSRRVGRLMRDNGVKVVRTRKYKATTNSKHGYAIAPNLLDRNFTAEQANQKWAVDISYIWTREGWLYLAVVMDLYSRRIVGWAVSNRMHKRHSRWSRKI